MPADAPRFFNVWLVQPNTVYRGVPFTVVCDWIQEGRLLGRDCVRTPGAAAWEYLDAHPLFAPYFDGSALPTPQDAAEALKPIEIDFGPEKRKEDEEEDVDMIPLIDISMVLLVFFMMTAQNLITAAPFKIPQVQMSEIADRQGNVIISIRVDPDDPEKRKVVYHFKENITDKFTEQEVLDKVREEKNERGINMKIMLQVESTIAFERVQSLMMGLESMGLKYVAKVGPKTSASGGESPE
ncbi:MAG TPA: biopolymer transporter ExbD [Gemmatales bacterium]|nr:biopolymer transporter ExbD [Gemmatales bacterium]